MRHARHRSGVDVEPPGTAPGPRRRGRLGVAVHRGNQVLVAHQPTRGAAVRRGGGEDAAKGDGGPAARGTDMHHPALRVVERGEGTRDRGGEGRRIVVVDGGLDRALHVVGGDATVVLARPSGPATGVETGERDAVAGGERARRRRLGRGRRRRRVAGLDGPRGQRAAGVPAVRPADELLQARRHAVGWRDEVRPGRRQPANALPQPAGAAEADSRAGWPRCPPRRGRSARGPARRAGTPRADRRGAAAATARRRAARRPRPAAPARRRRECAAWPAPARRGRCRSAPGPRPCGARRRADAGTARAAKSRLLAAASAWPGDAGRRPRQRAMATRGREGAILVSCPAPPARPQLPSRMARPRTWRARMGDSGPRVRASRATSAAVRSSPTMAISSDATARPRACRAVLEEARLGAQPGGARRPLVAATRFDERGAGVALVVEALPRRGAGRHRPGEGRPVAVGDGRVVGHPRARRTPARCRRRSAAVRHRGRAPGRMPTPARCGRRCPPAPASGGASTASTMETSLARSAWVSTWETSSSASGSMVGSSMRGGAASAAGGVGAGTGRGAGGALNTSVRPAAWEPTAARRACPVRGQRPRASAVLDPASAGAARSAAAAARRQLGGARTWTRAAAAESVDWRCRPVEAAGAAGRTAPGQRQRRAGGARRPAGTRRPAARRPIDGLRVGEEALEERVALGVRPAGARGWRPGRARTSGAGPRRRWRGRQSPGRLRPWRAGAWVDVGGACLIEGQLPAGAGAPRATGAAVSSSTGACASVSTPGPRSDSAMSSSGTLATAVRSSSTSKKVGGLPRGGRRHGGLLPSRRPWDPSVAHRTPMPSFLRSSR